MYVSKHFKINDADEVLAFIKENAFGQLISSVNGRLYSTHIPFLLDKRANKLLGHLALQNPQSNEIEDQEVLITLQGPHDYISPSWYEKPGVPTWNYQAVHIYGGCRLFRNEEKLQSLVDELSNKYESGFEQPWTPQYKPAMLKAIIGVEIEINEIQCQYKLSQNRPANDRHNVIQQLRKTGSKLADAMERNEKNL